MKLKTIILIIGFLLSPSIAFANENKVDVYDLVSTSSNVPTLDTVKLITADGVLNKELKEFMLKKHNKQVLKDKKIAILATDGVEELEILVPLNYLREVGANVTIVAPRKKIYPETLGLKIPENRRTHIMTVRLMENSGWLKIDKYIDEVSFDDFDGLVLPGGAWNPDFLRTDVEAQNLVREIVNSNKPLATICHGPLVLINSGLVKDRKITGYWAIMKDLENAGAKVYDQPVVIDGNLISSRFPYDLPRLMNSFTEKLLNN
ncbi:type 1 glutamine amidotransferase [Vibrio vulnificus]|uniref:type 1 glutamine amidotransferase domain-containing protein n=1 Tax=Vibrio vulnificus TaxID=672 RepID=UPI0021D9FBD8|nr:type 1 glutamine amidotransferase [Vibrio vulnificus]EIF2689952.1 type 1 glutamine amidotransferase [Vibrio vulnificus]EJR4267918.1 type 1 glutamine amidotransferase [Vibrio vulnificus]EJU9872182.1 type 1 glutamine amidotransferase [Vibrio vulnificus]EKA3722493.1 type 1 glutamine amidotransferase [Vibrio vulnificus]